MARANTRLPIMVYCTIVEKLLRGNLTILREIFCSAYYDIFIDISSLFNIFSRAVMIIKNKQISLRPEKILINRVESKLALRSFSFKVDRHEMSLKTHRLGRL